jgi:excisionase family DNA binding protein
MTSNRDRSAGHAPSVLINVAAQLLGVSRRTVYYRIRDGRLQTIRTRCGSQRVLLSSIDELRQQERRSMPPNGAAAVRDRAAGV